MQAAFFPRSFYDDFPFGRGLGRDGRAATTSTSSATSARSTSRCCVLTVGALFVGTRAVARLTALAWLVYSVPHFVYHLRHLSMPMAGAEKVALVVSLAITSSPRSSFS